MFRLSANVATSRARGRNISRSGTLIRATRSPRAQGLHPLRGSRDRAGDTPAHDQQGDQDDEDYVGQRAQERLAPNPKALGPDVSGIVNNRQAADHFVPPMQGEA